MNHPPRTSPAEGGADTCEWFERCTAPTSGTQRCQFLRYYPKVTTSSLPPNFQGPVESLCTFCPYNKTRNYDFSAELSCKERRCPSQSNANKRTEEGKPGLGWGGLGLYSTFSGRSPFRGYFSFSSLKRTSKVRPKADPGLRQRQSLPARGGQMWTHLLSAGGGARTPGAVPAGAAPERAPPAGAFWPHMPMYNTTHRRGDGLVEAAHAHVRKRT